MFRPECRAWRDVSRDVGRRARGSIHRATRGTRHGRNARTGGSSFIAAIPESIRSAGACTPARSEEHTSELQSLMRISYAVSCLKSKNKPVLTDRALTTYNH